MGGLKQLEKRKILPVYDSDEVSWIFAGYYFNVYFLRFDFLSPDWNDYEAFDQPPLGKYIVGGALYLKGYTIDSLDPKRFLNKNVPLVNPQKYFDLVTPKVPNPKIVIPFTRSVIFGFALSSLLLIYLSVRILYGVIPALISSLLIISNPIFNYVSTRILGDPILLFFFSVFILLCVLYSKSKNNYYIIFAFIASSLAFLTKLNGILLVFVFITVFLIKNKFSISKQDCKFLMIGFIAFLLINNGSSRK
jgi:4-amino-4-deoxy-L-arabinose transferase-like glycosyltransferase